MHMIEKKVLHTNTFFSLKCGFGSGYGIGLKVSTNFGSGFGIGLKPK